MSHHAYLTIVYVSSCIIGERKLKLHYKTFSGLNGASSNHPRHK